jgi:hypothetical protein
LVMKPVSLIERCNDVTRSADNPCCTICSICGNIGCFPDSDSAQACADSHNASTGHAAVPSCR